MRHDLKREIGLRTKAARVRLGITQEFLAEKIQRTVETVSKIERGVANPSMETLEDLARALQTPIREFFPEGSSPKRSVRRTEMELQARDVIASLGDAELEIALDQMKVLVASTSRGGRSKR